MTTAIEKREPGGMNYRHLFENIRERLQDKYPGVDLDTAFSLLEMGSRKDLSRQQKLEWFHQVAETREEQLALLGAAPFLRLELQIAEMKQVNTGFENLRERLRRRLEELTAKEHSQDLDDSTQLPGLPEPFDDQEGQG